MIAFLEGEIIEKTPTYIVISCNGVGYLVNISLNTYEYLPPSGKAKLHTLLIIREDAHVLYGFASQDEKLVFEQLISVSGVGAATARMMLSSLKPDELRIAIAEANLSAIKAIKGVGQKTAERIIVDLKDKIGKISGSNTGNSLFGNNKIKEEALSALVMLGFVKNQAEKAIEKSLKMQVEFTSVEELIKLTLKNL
jgi:Holliday junction DNA helicase RuvA